MTVAILSVLDRARVQRYHFWVLLIAGLGFFTDGYDLFCIINVTYLLGRLYYDDMNNLPSGVYGAVTSMAFCGAVFGQLYFGWAGDKLGRRKVYGITLKLMVVSSICCGLSCGNSPHGVITTLCFFRFWLGFGIGGDYPLSATIMSEYSNKRTRGGFVAAVFAMQGFGILTASVVTFILSFIFQAIDIDVDPDYLWRIVFMLGALPAAATYYFRKQMPETARYTALVLGDSVQATEDMRRVLDIPNQDAEMMPPWDGEVEAIARNNAYGLFSREFVQQHGKQLLGVSVCWLMEDIVFYSLNMYQSNMFTKVGWANVNIERDLEQTFQISRSQTYIALATIPGYWVTVFTIDKIGRKTIQLLGFFMTAIVLAIWAGLLERLPNYGFLALYALTLFFSNFGANATTFIIPAELFPARKRSTCNGIAAAAGKIGAIVGAFGIISTKGDLTSSEVNRTALGVIAICSGIGFLFTFLLPETKNTSLEELSGEETYRDAQGEETDCDAQDNDSVHIL